MNPNTVIKETPLSKSRITKLDNLTLGLIVVGSALFGLAALLSNSELFH